MANSAAETPLTIGYRQERITCSLTTLAGTPNKRRITKDYSEEKIFSGTIEPLSENSSGRDSDDTIKKALVLVVQFRKVSIRFRTRDGTPTRILVPHNLRIITTEGGHNQHYLGKSQQ